MAWRSKSSATFPITSPSIVIVSPASKAVEKAKERVRAVFLNAGLQLPRKHITLNLAPTDLPKSDSSFDLAMALAILVTSQHVPPQLLDHVLVMGELGLDGDVRPCRGIIGKLLTDRKLGFTACISPEANRVQAQLVPSLSLLPVRSIRQLYDYLTTPAGAQPAETG